MPPDSLSPETLRLLAILADVYTPILLLIAMIDVVRSWVAGNKHHILYLIYAVVIVYSLMFADLRWQLWATQELDYSTHSAAAFALVVLIGLYKSFRHRVLLLASLLAYAELMYVLNYHSWADMLATVGVCGFVLLPILAKRWRAKVSDSGKSAIPH